MVIPKFTLKRYYSKWTSNRRLSMDGYISINVKQMHNIGVSPLTREKFDELDTQKSGVLRREQVLELVNWVFRSSVARGLLFERELLRMWDAEIGTVVSSSSFYLAQRVL